MVRPPRTLHQVPKKLHSRSSSLRSPQLSSPKFEKSNPRRAYGRPSLRTRRPPADHSRTIPSSCNTSRPCTCRWRCRRYPCLPTSTRIGGWSRLCLCLKTASSHCVRQCASLALEESMWTSTLVAASDSSESLLLSARSLSPKSCETPATACHQPAQIVKAKLP